jgi:hypothetical protein
LAIAGASASPATGAQSSVENQARQFPARVLALHNIERAAVGMPPLRWDAQLGVEAARYAVTLALSRRFEHSAAASRRGTGENLWMGTRHAFSLEKMMASWSSEKSMFKAGVFPAISRTGNWHQVGHYTQIVWPTTTRVGCALATSSTTDYLVCRYDPAGNVHGNVLRVRPRVAAWRPGR